MGDAFEGTTNGHIIRFSEMPIGAPAGKGKRIEQCPKCGRPGARFRGTLIVHASTYQQTPSGDEMVGHVDKCSVGRSNDKPAITQAGFDWCPKEWCVR